MNRGTWGRTPRPWGVTRLVRRASCDAPRATRHVRRASRARHCPSPQAPRLPRAATCVLPRRAGGCHAALPRHAAPRRAATPRRATPGQPSRLGSADNETRTTLLTHAPCARAGACRPQRPAPRRCRRPAWRAAAFWRGCWSTGVWRRGWGRPWRGWVARGLLEGEGVLEEGFLGLGAGGPNPRPSKHTRGMWVGLGPPWQTHGGRAQAWRGLRRPWCSCRSPRNERALPKLVPTPRLVSAQSSLVGKLVAGKLVLLASSSLASLERWRVFPIAHHFSRHAVLTGIR
jgi:hypothetical protein